MQWNCCLRSISFHSLICALRSGIAVALKKILTLGMLVMGLCLSGCAESDDPATPQVSSGTLKVIPQFESSFVPARDILVWLQEGYSEDGE